MTGHLPAGMRLAACAAALAAFLAAAPRSGAQDARQKQEIIFAELPTRTVSDGPFDLVARATSRLPVSFEIVSGPAVLDGKELKLTGVPGLVIVRATQAGDALFRPALPAERAFAVTRRPAAPAILSQIAGATVEIGGIAVLCVEASGEPQPSYQWRKEGVPVAGATDRTFTKPSASLRDSGDYDVVVSNASGSVASGRVHLTVVKRRQTITMQGPNTLVAGQPVTLSVGASSGLPVRLEVVSGAAALSGLMMTPQTAGTVVVQASQEGDATYEAAIPVTQSYIIVAGPNGQRVP